MKHWKIERDSFYGDLYEEHGLEFIENAGFFDDGDTENRNLDESLNILCTPISNLKNALEIAIKPAVIVYTGSFCPFHAGHTESIFRARSYLRHQGYDHVTIYISPGHDGYISSKKKDLAIPIWERIRLINNFLIKEGADLDHIHVDPWEGVFNKVGINFTDVVERTYSYIKKWTGKSVPIFYLCGGDNARFAETFNNKGNCIVMGRYGYEQFSIYEKKLSNLNDRIHFVSSINDLSSSKIHTKPWRLPNKKQLNLRIDRKIDDRLLDIINDKFSFINPIPVEDLNDKKSKFPKNVINLDSLQDIENNNLEISRCYDMFGIDKILESQFVNRPGSVSLSDQILKIDKNKEYYLYDDDIHTGSTMCYAEYILHKAGIKTIGRVCSTSSNSENIEILDLRDFIIDDSNSGLVVKLPNDEIARVPYIYPYVDPYVRGSISDPLQFSIDIWKLNLTYFIGKGGKLKHFQHLKVFQCIGFGPEDYISHIIQWHINMLEEFK